MHKKSIIFIISLVIFAGGFASGVFVKCLDRSAKGNEPNEKRLHGYKFISPLLECDNIQNINKEIIPFKSDLIDLVEKEKKQYNITHTSIYFRDLNNGPWIGINEKEIFSPASMLKVPMAMAVFKLAEKNSKILQEQIKITRDINNDEQFFKPLEVIKKDNSYTIDDLIYQMIVYSDNNAMDELFNFIGMDQTLKVYTDVGISVLNIERQEDFMTVKDYASFFRILYNASYLNKEYSEKTLELLAKSNFKNGLVAGVPENITIAHKFGERIMDSANENQLHDCGIIYYPNKPYLLCVMNRGNDFDEMANFIKSISDFIYQEVNKQNK